jgi:hypothetical protein
MIDHSISPPESTLLTESALSGVGCAHLRRPYNGVWLGHIKMFRDLEHRQLMEFIDYQEILPAKDRVRRSKITDAGRTALLEHGIANGAAATALNK